MKSITEEIKKIVFKIWEETGEVCEITQNNLFEIANKTYQTTCKAIYEDNLEKIKIYKELKELLTKNNITEDIYAGGIAALRDQNKWLCSEFQENSDTQNSKSSVKQEMKE